MPDLQPDSAEAILQNSGLNQYRKTAETFYNTPEYQEKAQQIADIVRQIRGKVVAIDIAGTLVCSSLRYHFYPARHSPKQMEEILFAINLHKLDRLRRPFANEVLRAFADSDNETMLWTGEKPDDADIIIKTSGLNVPDGIRLITREQYLQKIKTSRRFQDAVERAFQYKRIGEGLREKFLAGTVKIPSAFGVDMLLDNNALKDADALKMLMGHESDESRGKFIQVESWDLHSTEDLQNHYKNEGLLRAIQQIAV